MARQRELREVVADWLAARDELEAVGEGSLEARTLDVRLAEIRAEYLAHAAPTPDEPAPARREEPGSD